MPHKPKFDIPMPILTPRLVLRPVKAGDGWAMHDTKAETWDMLQQWMTWATKPASPEEDEAAVRRGFNRFRRRTDIWLCGLERDTGKTVVWTGLHRPDWKARSFMIGYWVTKSAQGKGYATEVTNALTRYGFEALHANEIWISHGEGNDASRRVIEKLGFVRDGFMKEREKLPDGRIIPGWRYTRANADGLPPLDVSWGPQP